MAVDAGLGQSVAPVMEGGFGMGPQGPMQPQGVPGMQQATPYAPNMRDLLAGSHEAFDQALAQNKALKESASRVDVARKTLDKLVTLGDTITPDDVMEASAHLVGHGFEPKALAELLSTMPLNGSQALQGWVKENDQKLQMAEASIKPALAQSVQHLAGRAMASLHLDHLERTQGPSPNPPGSLDTPISAALGGTPNAQ